MSMPYEISLRDNAVKYGIIMTNMYFPENNQVMTMNKFVYYVYMNVYFVPITTDLIISLKKC